MENAKRIKCSARLGRGNGMQGLVYGSKGTNCGCRITDHFRRATSREPKHARF